MTTKAETKTKGMCIATRCTSVEQFIQMFHRFVDEESFFVSTLNTRPPGLETSFSVQLADGTPVLRGLCVVMQAWTTAANPFKTPGVRLGIKRLTANSMQVFERLLVTRSAAKPPPIPAPKPSGLAVVIAPKSAIPSAAPRAIPKSPYNETAPTRHAPSRVELKQPARPSTDPAAAVPEQIPAEPTDVIEEKTDVREPKLDLREPKVIVRKDSEAEVTIPEPQRLPPMAAAPVAPPVEAPPLNAAPKTEAEKASAAEQAEQFAKPLDIEKPPEDGERTPGSELVLPANPLMGLNDESIEGYVECTLYEETGNYFSVDDDGSLLIDDIAPPPILPANPLAPAPIALDVSARTLVASSDAPDSFEKNPDTELAAKRFETSPKAPAYQEPATEPQRDSSPALVVPPPPPPIEIPRKPDPAVIARGSMPVLGHVSPVVATPIAPPNKSQKWWLIGSLLALVAAGAVFVVTTQRSESNNEPSRDPLAKKQELPAVAPQPQPPTEPVTDDMPDDVPEATGDGPPVVGSGPCEVVVNSTPAGSMVIVDGKGVGPSPLTVATTCETHKIDLKHPRYQLGSKTVSLSQGKQEAIDVTLSRPTHTVTVTSNPSGATIFIDGRRAGTTPTKLSVLGFVTLKLEFKKTGYAPAAEKFYSRYAVDKVNVKLTKW